MEDGSPTYTILDEGVENGEEYFYTVIAIAADGCISGGDNTKSILVALPELDVAALVVDDTTPPGDGDGIPEPGEPWLLTFDLSEIAGIATTNVTAVLVTPDPLVAIVDPGPKDFGDFVGSDTRTQLTPFRADVALKRGCDSLVPFTLHVTSDDGCWAKAYSVTILRHQAVPARIVPRRASSPQSSLMTA